MGTTFSQFFPPHPTMTEASLPSQKGKGFVVTGGASGVGLELCALLYHAGGKVYLAGRSETKAQAAIAKIQARSVISSGELHFLLLSLDDLATIRPAVEAFMAKESRLDVLFNNAGVSLPPRGSVSAQGHELQMATNCLVITFSRNSFSQPCFTPRKAPLRPPCASYGLPPLSSTHQPPQVE